MHTSQLTRPSLHPPALHPLPLPLSSLPLRPPTVTSLPPHPRMSIYGVAHQVDNSDCVWLANEATGGWLPAHVLSRDAQGGMRVRPANGGAETQARAPAQSQELAAPPPAPAHAPPPPPMQAQSHAPTIKKLAPHSSSLPAGGWKMRMTVDGGEYYHDCHLPTHSNTAPPPPSPSTPPPPFTTHPHFNHYLPPPATYIDFILILENKYTSFCFRNNEI